MYDETTSYQTIKMINSPIPRLDKNPELRNCLLKYARLNAGEVCDDPLGKHRIGCLDSTSTKNIFLPFIFLS